MLRSQQSRNRLIMTSCVHSVASAIALDSFSAQFWRVLEGLWVLGVQLSGRPSSSACGYWKHGRQRKTQSSSFSSWKMWNKDQRLQLTVGIEFWNKESTMDRNSKNTKQKKGTGKTCAFGCCLSSTEATLSADSLEEINAGKAGSPARIEEKWDKGWTDIW